MASNYYWHYAPTYDRDSHTLTVRMIPGQARSEEAALKELGEALAIVGAEIAAESNHRVLLVDVLPRDRCYEEIFPVIESCFGTICKVTAGDR